MTRARHARRLDARLDRLEAKLDEMHGALTAHLGKDLDAARCAGAESGSRTARGVSLVVSAIVAYVLPAVLSWLGLG